MQEDIIELLKTKYGSEIAFNEPILEEYHTSRPLNTDHILNTYQIRYTIFQEKMGVPDKEYELLIHNLRQFKNDKLLIHRFKLHGEFYLVFTNLESNFLIGCLVSVEDSQD